MEVKMLKLNQQGFVLTVAAFLLAGALVSTAFTVRNTGWELQESRQVFVSMESVKAKYENYSDNIREILENIGKLSWTVENGMAVFTETIPNKRQKNAAELNLEDYQRFALQYTDGLDVNLKLESVSVDRVVIQPFDVNYDHTQNPGQSWKEQNETVFSPKEINFQGYVLDITLQNQTFNDLVADIKACVGACTKAVYVDVNVRNSNKIAVSSFRNNNVDPNKVSTITIKSSGNAGNDIVITLGPNGKLSTKNNNSVPVEVIQSIDFGQGTEPFIALPTGLIQVGNDLGQRKE